MKYNRNKINPIERNEKVGAERMKLPDLIRRKPQEGRSHGLDATCRRREQRKQKAPGPKERLLAWWRQRTESLMQDEWIHTMVERRRARRMSGLEKLHSHQRRKRLEQEAAQLVGLKARIGFAIRHHKVVATASMGLAIALLLSGVGMGASYLASQKSIMLLVGSQERYCVTTAQSVGELLEEQGLFLGNDGKVQPSPDTLLVNGMTVQYAPRISVVIEAAGQQQRYFFYSGTVADALEEAGLTYDEDDRIEPSADAQLADGMTIKLTRYDTNTVVENERLYYQVKEVEDPEMYVGQSKVVQAGREGELVRTVSILYEDGVEKEREVVSEERTVRPRNELVVKGVKPTPTPTPTPTPAPTPTAAAKEKADKTEATAKPTAKKTAKPTATPKKTASPTKKPAATPAPTKGSIPGTPDTYEKKLSMMITAYTHTGNKTALGTWPVATRTRENPGTVAVAPQTIPYHTLLYVPGYGYCLAEDTGGFRHDRPYQIDLFMDTEDECINWGRKRDYTVYIVEYNYKR